MDTQFLILHGLAVRKFGSADEVGESVGVPAADAEQALAEARDGGQVVEAKGRFMLTPGGRSRLDEAYPEQFAGLREDPELDGVYKRFEEVNRELLDLFTRWQTVEVGGESVPNDHTDAEYDAGIVDELGALHERAVPVLGDFASVVERYALYRDRLDAGYDRVLAGEHEFVSGAKVDSYHNVWFQLHEDLLRVLGRERETYA